MAVSNLVFRTGADHERFGSGAYLFMQLQQCRFAVILRWRWRRGWCRPQPVPSRTTFSTNENVARTGTFSATDPSGSASTSRWPPAPKLARSAALRRRVNSSTRRARISLQRFVLGHYAAGHATTSMISITVTVNQGPLSCAPTLTRVVVSKVNAPNNATDPDRLYCSHCSQLHARGLWPQQ